MAELENEYFELGGLLICSLLSSLADIFGMFNDIGLTVRRQVMLLERFDEISE